MTASRWLVVMTRGLETTSPRPSSCSADSSTSSRLLPRRIEYAIEPAAPGTPRLVRKPWVMVPAVVAREGVVGDDDAGLDQHLVDRTVEHLEHALDLVDLLARVADQQGVGARVG